MNSKCQRGVKRWACLAQPIVERVFGPPNGCLTAGGQTVGHFVGFVEQLVFIDRQRHQANALGFRSRD